MSIGVEEGASSDEVMGKHSIVADIAVNGLGFARKSKGATIGSADLQGAAIGEIKRKARQGLGAKQMAEVRHAAASEEHVGSSRVGYEAGRSGERQ